MLLSAALVLALAPCWAPAEASPARSLLDRAVERGRQVAHRGEVIAVTWDAGEAHVTESEVAAGVGAVVLEAPGRRLSLGGWGGGLADSRHGWYQELPAGGPSDPVADLEDKYRVRRVGESLVLDRPTVCLEVVRRDDGRLRERFEVDQVTGLVLRRESFDADVRLRLATYSRIDLRPAVAGGAAGGPLDARARQELEWRGSDVTPVGTSRLPALREGGWVVPAALPDGYRPAGVYAVDSGGGQHLQQVFDDGLYSVSLFQQRGRGDWDALPDGARAVPDLGDRAVEWPGAMPRQIVWEMGGTTLSLVGDAPPAELRALAAAVPAPEGPGLLGRLKTGLGRLWSRLSPWD